jgi:acetyl-CoA carboxylase, biotin carboxylase subunit
VLEEAPAPGIDSALIAAVGERCAQACRQIGYCGVGTFEFLYENGAFYFIEMNTRLQVEHPVTEMTAGIDIVQQQLRVARGERLAIEQSDIACRGHALECRINAENPDTFAPSPGLIGDWVTPGGFGVRVDTHAGAGYRVPPYYDSMIAKLIVHGTTREDALVRMRVALDEMRIGGIATNLQLHRQIVRDPEFAGGGVDTHHLERWLARRAPA